MGYEFEHDEIMAYAYTEISIRQQPSAGMTQKIFKWEFQPRISSLSNSIGVRQPSEEMTYEYLVHSLRFVISQGGNFKGIKAFRQPSIEMKY